MISRPWHDLPATRWPKIATLVRSNATRETEGRSLSEPLARLRRIGLVLLGMQFAGLLAWTTLVYNRFALTNDYAEYVQAWYLIAHGNLNPYDTVFNFPFWQDHFDLLMWPLSLFSLVWPHYLWLSWIQVSCVAAAEFVAFNWLCDIAHDRLSGDRSREAAWLAGVGLILLVASPWIVETVSYDFHLEPVAVPFVTLLARDLAKGRRRAWAWTAPLLLLGDVATTYVVGVGLGAALASRKWRHRGAVVACVGICAVLFIALIHGNQGSGAGLQKYDYLAGPNAKHLGPIALITGAATHPLRVAGAFWHRRLVTWYLLAPSGLLGICSIPLLPLFVVALSANILFAGTVGILPNFQNVVLFVLVPVGTVSVLGYVWRRHALVARLLAILVVMQALVWAVVWGPQIRGQWLRVSAPTAETLAAVQAQIPASAEVIVSAGVMGRFANHANVQRLFRTGPYPISGQTWFVLAPEAGIEPLTTDSVMALVGELAGPLHAQLITSANGIWAFRLQPPAGMHTVTVPGGYGTLPPLPAWTATGTAGRRIMAGPVSDWRMTATGGKGYVADSLAWQEPLGRYRAEVTLSASGPVTVEVWNDTDYNHDVLLARRFVPGTAGRVVVDLPVDASTAYYEPLYTGWGPFHAVWWNAPPGQRLELRVWSPGGESVNVYNADLAPAPAR